MKKNKKNKLIVFIIVLAALLLVVLGYFILSSKNKNSLTLEENKWIDSNKHEIIDVAVMSDLPILSYNGSGMFYDYLNYITKKHALKFNVVSYKLDSTIDYSYKLDITSSISDDEIVLFKDNLILVTKTNNQYTDINDITNLNTAFGRLSSGKR